MTTNPERLWAYVYNWSKPPFAHVGTRACLSKDEVSKARAVTRCDSACTPSEPAEYVLASVAALAQDKALDEKHAQMVAMSDRLRGKVSAADAEAAALRAEVEALRSGEFVRAVTEERNAYREALEKVVALMAPAQVWEPWAAKEVAKAALAVKP